MKKTRKPEKKPTDKQRLYDMMRHSGKGMRYQEGPYDRVYGKDMRPEESVEKRKTAKLRKGGLVRK